MVRDFFLVGLFAFANLTRARIIWKEGPSIENTLLSDWPVSVSIFFFLIGDWYERVHPTVGNDILS